MTYGIGFSADRMAREFTGYICENKAHALHIRQITPWLGFMIKGIEKVKTGPWWIPRTRQLHFEVGSRRFKAKYVHEDGGGIDIVEIAVTTGEAELAVIYQARSLDDAERFYLLPQLSSARQAKAA